MLKCDLQFKGICKCSSPCVKKIWYEKGKADGIDEFAEYIHEDLYQFNHHQVDFLAEQLKEQTNE